MVAHEKKDGFIFCESEMSFEELLELPRATGGAKALSLKKNEVRNSKSWELEKSKGSSISFL